MKSLKESIFSDVEDIVNNDTALIEQFLKDNYEIHGTYNIADNVVDVKGDVNVKNEKIESLTHGLFRFGTVTGHFICTFCPKLTSLEGGPEKVGKDFDCSACPGLVSLKSAPKEVGWDFYCNDCPNLTTLEGVPEEVGGDFYCNNCTGLTTLEGAPKKVNGDFWCTKCSSLISLKGAPEEVGGSFWCSGCRKLKITDQDRKKYIIES